MQGYIDLRFPGTLIDSEIDIWKFQLMQQIILSGFRLYISLQLNLKERR